MLTAQLAFYVYINIIRATIYRNRYISIAIVIYRFRLNTHSVYTMHIQEQHQQS